METLRANKGNMENIIYLFIFKTPPGEKFSVIHTFRKVIYGISYTKLSRSELHTLTVMWNFFPELKKKKVHLCYIILKYDLKSRIEGLEI